MLHNNPPFNGDFSKLGKSRDFIVFLQKYNKILLSNKLI